MSAIPSGGATSSPLYIRPGPVATPVSENGRRAASHSLVPVAQGQGLRSQMSDAVERMNMATGIDQLTGHGGRTNLGKPYSRYARGGRPGGLSTAEALGPMSGPMA